MERKKNYNIKIYTLSWVYLRTLAPNVVMNGVNFSSQMNGGQGEARIRLAIPFNTSLVTYNNIIKIYESDDANPTGRIIYTGIVGSLQRANDNGAEYIEIRAVGLASMLSWLYYDQSGGSYAFNKNQEASLTIKDIIDRFSTKYPSLITYTGTSIESSGLTANLAFSYDKAIDALKKTAQTTQFWWTIDRAGVLQFHPVTAASGQIHHKVDMGAEVDTILIEENTEKLVNNYILTYSAGTVTSTDAPSQAAYGIRELKEDKTNITDSTTANATAATYIAQNKEPKRKISLTINNNYDIESIQPGDIMTVLNVDLDISALQITKIEYNPDNIKVALEDYNSIIEEISTI